MNIHKQEAHMHTNLSMPVKQRTKDELMAAHWRSKTCAQYDNKGTVRTGTEWFNRYMLYPWERSNDFELVTQLHPASQERENEPQIPHTAR